MKRFFIFFIASVLSVGLIGCSSPAGEASEAGGESDVFPSKSLQLYVPFQAGDSADLSSRAIADRFLDVLGQPMAVVNKSTGGGSVAATEVSQADADGYLLLNGSFGLMTAKPYMEKLNYSHEDFIPVAQYAETPLAFAVHKDAPYNTLEELIAYAKENPDEVKYSVPGAGTIQHITMLSFEKEYEVELVDIPYEGGSAALNAVLAMDVDAILVGAGVLKGQYEADGIKVLGTTSAERISIMPDVATFTELGYPVEAGVWFGAFVPKDTPADIVQTLSDTIGEISAMEEVQEQLLNLGLSPAYMNTEDFSARVQADAARNYEILSELGKVVE